MTGVGLIPEGYLPRPLRLFGWFVAMLAVTTHTAMAKDVLVFAAASLTLPLQSIIDQARKESSGTRLVRASFASSSTLAQQINNGAPADIYISANPAWMNFLAAKGAIEDNSRVDLLGNKLVVVSPVTGRFAGAVTFELQLLKTWRIAMGDPDHVPAGQYARAALQEIGIWNAMQSNLIRTGNVRAALALIERGEVQGGIVYLSDATNNPRVKIAHRFSAKSHRPIRYPAAILAGRRSPEVNQFFSHLRSPSALAIFKRHGFDVNPSDVRPYRP